MEIWKDVVSYEGFYEVSNLGRIRNKRTKNLLTSYINEHGYCVIGLYNRKSSKTVHYRVHRLVAYAFIGNPDKKRTVNHADGNKQNNCVENLEWATHKENLEHARRMGLIVCTEKQRNAAKRNIWRNKLLSNNNRKKVFSIDADGNKTFFESIREAAKSVGVNPSAIVNCLKGKTRKSAGLEWGYCDGD